MKVVFNMVDGSEIFMNNVKSIVDVGRDLCVTIDFAVLESGTIVNTYISKVGQVRKNHFMNCVTSYQSDEMGVVLIDYHFYDLINNKLYSRKGVSDYVSQILGGRKNDEKR